MCVVVWFFFCFKQKTAYEMRISDWSSDVCSSDLRFVMAAALPFPDAAAAHAELARIASEASLRAVQIVAQTTGYRPDQGFDEIFRLAAGERLPILLHPAAGIADLSPAFDDYGLRSEEHTSALQSLMRISYAVLRLQKKKKQ